MTPIRMHCNWSTDHAIDYSSTRVNRLINIKCSIRYSCLHFGSEHRDLMSGPQRTIRKKCCTRRCRESGLLYCLCTVIKNFFSFTFTANVFQCNATDNCSQYKGWALKSVWTWILLWLQVIKQFCLVCNNNSMQVCLWSRKSLSV